MVETELAPEFMEPLGDAPGHAGAGEADGFLGDGQNYTWL